MILQVLMLTVFGGAFLTYLAGKLSFRARDILAFLISAASFLIIVFHYNASIGEIRYLEFLNIPLTLKVDNLSWLFAISIQAVTLLSVLFSWSYMKGRERLDFYYFMMLMVNAGMLGIVLAGDMLSFYLFWEVMSWSAFLLISYKRGPALPAGMKYIAMSLIGSVSMLTAILSLYANYGTLAISELFFLIPSASSGYLLFLLLLFFIAFGIKNAVWPLHTWLPPAHSEAPSPFSAVLSGILVRMGMYGLLVIFYAVDCSVFIMSLPG